MVTTPLLAADNLQTYHGKSHILRSVSLALARGETVGLMGRALLTNPRVLVLDEATEGLAPLIRDEIWRAIRLVRDAGIATHVVDKTIGEVTAIADRGVVLVKGEVQFNGTPKALLADHALMQRTLGVSG